MASSDVHLNIKVTHDKIVTERTAVLRERNAFRSGVNALYFEPEYPAGGEHYAGVLRAVGLADALYPLPKVARPRELSDSTGVRWRIIPPSSPGDTHRIEYAERWTTTTWHDVLASRAGDPGMTSERIRLLNDLLDNPTELLEAEP